MRWLQRRVAAALYSSAGRPMNDAIDALRNADLPRVLRALALGETTSQALTEACLAAIARDAHLNAWIHVDADGARAAARASDARRAAGGAIGRLDGVPLALNDNFDAEGMPTSQGLPLRDGLIAFDDSAVAARLRGAGAVLLGKTNMDEAALGTSGRNPHYGDVGNPHLPGCASGGSSSGAAAAVAAGHAIAAVGSDTVGSVRLPATFCGLVGLKPTFGEISCRGMAPALRRLDCPGTITRSVADAALLLKVMAGYDPGDPYTRARRVPFATPDWEPGRLKVGLVSGLRGLGASPQVVDAFRAAVERAGPVLGQAREATLDMNALDISTSRHAALLLMEAEILAAQGQALAEGSERLRGLLAYAETRTAADYVRADRRLDEHVVEFRARFADIDVLLLPVAPGAPPAAGDDEPGNLADFTALASLAGCPALSLPLPGGLGLQLVGPRGSDLRLIELGEILQAVLGAEAG
ncbi:amidase [Coralloluteibacterium stylophorae]|uniref:Amidase n=2 Tax=Coralloluteibacterium stylophorae TaxID=1776034 RepID=A0AAP2CCM8_9GAMM|nr:amidase [Coralloluteibacterium stylophorae]